MLAYGNGRRSGAGGYDWFPRIEKVGMGPSLFDVDLTHQWELEGALPEPELPEPGERPPNVVRLEDVEPELLDRGEFGDSSRELGAAGGSVETGLNHSDIPPGKLNCPVHCHASEEEVFVVLEGDGVCILGEEEHAVRAGSVVARPPRTRVGHAFRAGTGGMKLLAYGTREPNDIAWYPRSKKVYFRGPAGDGSPFVGKSSCQGALGVPRCELGEQERALGGTRLFVLPSTSPANAAVPYEERLHWFSALAAALSL